LVRYAIRIGLIPPDR